MSHAAIFGSLARDEQRPDSDIDIMVEIDPGMKIGVYGYVSIMNYIKDMFPVPVDVSNRSSLKDYVRPSAPNAMRSLPSDHARSALLDIRRNTSAVRDFIEGIDLGTFESDLKVFYAVTRALEIISEASRRLPEEVKAEHAGFPWRAIHDAGNAHRHGHDNIEATYIWDTVQDDIPKLSVVIDEVLAAYDKIRQTEPPP